MIEVAFTRSELFMSKVIRKVTGEDVSHCVIIVDGTWILHSNFSGVHVEYVEDFKEHSEIVAKFEINVNKERVLDSFDHAYDHGYDVGGMLFLGLLLICRRYLPWLTPKQNLWQTTGMYMCTEWVTRVVDSKENSLITPGQLRDILQQKGNQ